MKKALRSILACALAFVAVACYDDSALQKKYEDLNERLTVVEQSLQSETNGLAALLTKIDELKGKIAAIKVETVDGVTTLTLSDGSSVVLAKNGVLTIEEDGNWATVAPDGTVKPLSIKVGHDLLFKVENGELKVSYDGTTYEATGVKISEYTAHVIGDVAVAEDGKSVTITIGGNSVELPLVSSAVASLGLSRDSFFLRHTGEKIVTITAEGLKDVYVMNEPAGWKASIDENELVIVAPKAAHIEQGLADESGLVLVHATTAEGKCIVAKIEVTTGLGLTLEVDNSGAMVVRNSYVGDIEVMDPSTWETSIVTGFQTFYIGLATPSLFLHDVDAYMKYVHDNYETPSWDDLMVSDVYGVDFKERPEYVEGVYETHEIQMNVADIADVFYTDLNYGDSWVVWVAPADPVSGKVVLEGLQYVPFTYQLHDVKATATHSNITLDIEAIGADKYAIGAISDADLYGASFDEYMTAPMGGRWTAFTNWGSMEAVGTLVEGQLDGEFNLAEVANMNILPGTKYYVWVMPIYNSKSVLDEEQSEPEYDYFVYDNSAYIYESDFLPYVFEVKTNDLQPGGNYNPTMEKTSDSYAQIDVKLTPAEGAESVYYSFYSMSDWSDFDEDDAKVKEDLFQFGDVIGKEAVVKKTFINEAGVSYVLATLSIGADGKYSQSYETFSTKEAPKSADIAVEKVSVVEDGDNYVVTISVTGATKALAYNIAGNENNLKYFENKLATVHGHKASYSGLLMAEVAEGQVTYTFAKNATKTHLYVTAVNVENNVVSAMAGTTLEINLAEEAVKPEPASIDGKQWTADFMYGGVYDATLILDFGVTTEGMATIYADIEAMGGTYPMGGGNYTITPIDATSGTIVIVDPNDPTGAELVFNYTDLTGTGCKLTCTAEAFPMENATATVTEFVYEEEEYE
jgi:hypothetical protein